MDLWRHTVDLPCTALSISAARDFVARLLIAQGRTDVVQDASIIVSELSTNSVLHARSGFTLTIFADAGGLVISVSDGSGDLPVRRHPSPAATSGRGLQIVEALSGGWGIDVHAEGGKTVWARLQPGGVDVRRDESGVWP